MGQNFDVNLKEFNRVLKKFSSEVVIDKLRLIQKKIVLTALQRVVEKTPVRTGRARGNWQVTINKLASGVVDNSNWEKKRKKKELTKDGYQPLNKDDHDAINKGIAAIKDLPPFCIVYISNNLDYIEFLENGSSEQAPEGMVATTIAELKQMFRNYK